MTTLPSDSAGKRTLVLMRHAKSDWADSSLSDHDRPLNSRGQKAAPLMAYWLADNGITPEKILCSSAQRTQETVSLMTPCWESNPELSILEGLYLASPETILNTIASGGGDAAALMVVAHNPGTAGLASYLAQQAIDMPTAAIAIFKFSISDWNQLSADTQAELVDYMRPKAL